MKIKIGNEEVVLDSKILEIDEVNLNEILKTFPAQYCYYNWKWAKAQQLFYLAEDEYDVVFSDKFKFYKQAEGGSDKLAEAKTKANPEVVEAKKSLRQAKYVMQVLYTYLRSLDKVHENALNVGYNLRKEMDTLYPQSVKLSKRANLDSQIEEMFKND